MIVYNVTCNVSHDISEEWFQWMTDVHIPEVMNLGIFISSRVHKVITGNDEGVTYAISYTCNEMKDLHRYQIEFASILQQKHSLRYGNKVVAFRTILEVIRNF